MGVYCSKKEVVEAQSSSFIYQRNRTTSLEEQIKARCPNSSANFEDENSHSTKHSSEGKMKCTKVCFICHERVRLDHSCTNQMVKDLEKHMDKDQLMDILMKIKQQVSKDEQSLVPYLHWGTNVALIFNPFTQGLQRTELARNIPEFSRTILARENRIFCIGGQDSSTMKSLPTIFEVDIEEHYRIKDKMNMNQARFHHTAVYDQKYDFIFVIGGMTSNSMGNQFKMLSSCEFYRVQQNEWSIMPNLKVARDTCAACLFDSQWVYVFGGRVQFEKRQLTNVIERAFFSRIDVSQWEEITLQGRQRIMPEFNVGMCHQVNDTELVIFGGKDTYNKQTREVLYFDTSSFSLIHRKSQAQSRKSSNVDEQLSQAKTLQKNYSTAQITVKDFRMPLEIEAPTSPFQIANNLFVLGWSKETNGIHLLRLSLINLNWKEELDFTSYLASDVD
ncbi:kelch motif family protein [Stylonychia lemnae]|uniref:Kelch motif family protein n=1 Tax=Stylonychia lemnae TaxID=5949 RepID=A0A078B825_STYLE|nr:kelch motif family protein [Stylonychia lemnae]|eukprot:CDW89427.1 kelch motif family protein [Stylonychia lemnae]